MMNNIKIMKNYILWFLTFIFICIIGISNVFADTKTIYSSNSSGSLSGSNQYLYGSLSGGGTQTISTGSVGSTITGKSYGFTFWFYENLSLNKTYELTINFKSDDLVPNFSSNWVDIKSCASSSCNSNTIVSVQKQSVSGYSTWLKVKFNPISAGSYVQVNLASGNNDALTGGASGGGTYFGISSIILTSTNENQTIIDNQTNNTNNIINNQNSNTQDIINNQNQNTQQQIESQQVCEKIDKNNIEIAGAYLDSSGSVISFGNDWGVTNYIKIDNNSKIKVLETNNGTVSYCFYNINKIKISCTYQGSYNINDFITIPNNSDYVRFNIRSITNRPQLEVCKNGNQALSDNINNLNDSLNDDDSSGATSEASEFFSSFNTNTFGLTSIITAPLNLIQSLTSSSCTDLHLPLPYLNDKYLDLPCMTTIYSQYFGSFFTIYQTITYGIIAYWVCVRIFNQVKDFKNPEHDEIEVVDL